MPPGWPAAAGTSAGAQCGEVRVAVGDDRRHAVQRAAQDDDDEAPVGGRGGQGQRGAAEGDGGAEAQQGGAAGEWRVRCMSAPLEFG